MNTSLGRDAETVNALYEALNDIVGVCQSDLETHFGKNIAKKVRKALALAEGRT